MAISPFRSSLADGFTLIELAIVLVIIGLIAGGVLVGRELILTAEIRATITQLEKFNTAAMAFKGKYNCLPGDCPNVADFGFDIATNGNGDGKIGLCRMPGSCYFSTPGNDTLLGHESIDFWYHLSAAGLINASVSAYVQSGVNPSLAFITPGPGASTPKAPVASRFGNSTSPGGWWIDNELPGINMLQSHHLTLAAEMINLPVGGLSSYANRGSYPAMVLYAIDSKIDDGRPTKGTAQAWSDFIPASGLPSYIASSGPCPGSFFPPPTSCMCNETNGTRYYLESSGSNRYYHCNLSVKTTF